MRFNLMDNVITRALSKICDMICLNVLWVICSIPIVTIGASTTALYTVMLKMVRNEEGYIFRGFFKAFKENFRQSTIMWLILLVTSIVCFIDFRVAGVIAGAPGTVLRGIFFLLGFFLLAVMAYTFPLTARYENTIRATLRNAALLSLGRLPYTLLLGASGCRSGHILMEQRHAYVCDSALVSDWRLAAGVGQFVYFAAGIQCV